MPQLWDGAYINHFTSSFLNAWKVLSHNRKKNCASHGQKHLFLSWSKRKNWIILFPTEKYDAGVFFYFFSGLRQKEKNKKKHIWNPHFWNFLF